MLFKIFDIKFRENGSINFFYKGNKNLVFFKLPNSIKKSEFSVHIHKNKHNFHQGNSCICYNVIHTYTLFLTWGIIPQVLTESPKTPFIIH